MCIKFNEHTTLNDKLYGNSTNVEYGPVHALFQSQLVIIQP